MSLVAFATLSSLGALACEAGELDDRQEGYLRKQLDKHYPNGGGQLTEDASPSPESTTQPPDETTEPAPTSDSPITTSEPNPTSAPAAGTSEADTGTEDSTAANQVPACALQTFQTACAGNACHYQGAINLPPNFETEEDLFTMLTTDPVSCGDAPSPLYIDIANPLNSYLLVKLRGEQPAGCGSIMPPPGQGSITQAQIDCLEDWIGSL